MGVSRHDQTLLLVGGLAYTPKGKKSWVYKDMGKRDRKVIQHLQMLNNLRLSLTGVMAWLKEMRNGCY